MRAIIKCITNIDPKDLDTVLTEKDWWPALDQNHEEVLRRRDEIFNHVADGDRAIAEKTYLFTIYDEATKSWGIINNPTKHGLTFRIKNPDSDRLKSACERLVNDLEHLNGRSHGETPTKIRFISKIEVLEPNSSDHAYSGEVLPAGRFTLALKQRRTEIYVGLLAGLGALFFLILTLPPIAHWLLSGLPGEWPTFSKGFLDRLATSAIVTSTVALLNVVLHWLELRRKSVIRWSFD